MCYLTTDMAPYVLSDSFRSNFLLRWFLAYQAAMSFRFSHYFVSFLSECTSLLSGIGMEVNQKGKQETIW